MTHKKAILLFHKKYEYADGEIVEVKAWAVPPSPAKPEGIKYSFVYIGKEGTRILGYDNAEGKGHHKHLGGREQDDMTRKNITIKVQSLTELMSELASVVRDAQAGKIGPPRVGLSFESIDAVRNVLTPKRLGLLKAIREGRPKSVYALAKATRRPLKNTQDDVAMLARLDLVELKRGHGKRSPLEPRVRYDSIRLDIPLHDAR